MEDFLRRADLDDAPGVDHRDTVGERQRLLAIVRDVHRGDADAPLQRAELVAQLEAHLVIEIGHRLVEQQQMRIDGQRAAERDTLALAAGKLRHRALA